MTQQEASNLWWSIFHFIRERAEGRLIGEGTLLSDIKHHPAALVQIVEHHFGVTTEINKPMAEVTVGYLIRAVQKAKNPQDKASEAASEAS